MLDGGNFFNASGVILYRNLSGEKNLWLKLFLKNIGIVNVTSKKTRSNAEPFLWGNFNLKKKQKTTNYLIEDFEVVDDMLFLRKRHNALFTAAKWFKIIIKHLISGQPDNELLANLYWSMQLLKEPKVPVDVSDWKFLWQWLTSWGLAPDLVNFHKENNFNHDEIIILTQVSILNIKGVIDLFSGKLSSNIRKNSFKIATGLAERFFNEK